MILISVVVATGNAIEPLPLPPMQGKPWKPPKSNRLPPSWLEAAGHLLSAGFPDPRGCSYREVDITIGYNLLSIKDNVLSRED